MSDITDGIGRRAVLQTLMGGAAGALALPAVATAHPMTEHLHDQKKVTTADQKAHATSWKPEFLDQHQVDTVRVLAEKIVPGSTPVKSAEFIDSLLAVDTQANQEKFLQALGAFEALAIGQAKVAWRSLSDADQIALLTKASTATAAPPRRSADPVAPSSAEGPLTIRDHFELLKGWISGAYYSSEPGMRELGWTGNVFHDKFVGCEHGTH